MTVEEQYRITSEDYIDLFIEYNRNEYLLNRFPDSIIHTINPRYAVAYAPASILVPDFISRYGYSSLPHCYGLTSEKSLEASGVYKLRRFPAFRLRGSGVLAGIIDTGIDYTNPIFRREDGTSKIASIWDQTIASAVSPLNTFYGTEYTNEQINKALASSNPLAVVPSTDENGHGTMLAGTIVGKEMPESDFSGVVPDADLIVVKLKQAKQVLMEYYEIPLDVPCYQENDIIWALTYILETARILGRPCSVCIGLGSSQGSHDSRGPLNKMSSFIGDSPGTTVCISAGNEGNSRRHFFSLVDPSIGYSTVDLTVGENEPGFTMELWGTAPNTYSIDILSPTGEYIPRIPESIRFNQQIRFIFENTTIYLNYQLVETHTGEQIIILRFQNPTPGTWKFQVYSKGDLTGSFHIWLPMNGFLSKDTYFVKSNPYTTITSPGNALSPITLTAYDSVNNVLLAQASKGYTRTDIVKPELAAPGGNVVVPTLDHGFTTASGTGLAAAHATGITAIFLEWGIIQNNHPEISSTEIKKYLIRGAKRNGLLEYPNPDWGYGIIDLYNSFNILRGDFPNR
ncbi:S8 family peptidase [Anaeromicropila populeti]|uniref:Subtilase family protein n=1 Tax=Anaeromicropila populeti TaxID=37658 RepID=A0A1I6HY30_9FIRM|nr:S8 family peptidase [Anaeromicropila populeti]SFR59351.1 Subtilase family protein [Anaeromicropila populeti]